MIEQFLKYKKQIYARALKLMKNREDAEDLIQNTFINLYKSNTEIRSSKAFFMTSINNTGLNTYAARKSYCKARDGYLEANSVKNKNILDRFDIDLLSDVQKEVFTLYYIEGYTLDEISKKLNMNRESVKFHNKMSCKILKENL